MKFNLKKLEEIIGDPYEVVKWKEGCEAELRKIKQRKEQYRYGCWKEVSAMIKEILAE